MAWQPDQWIRIATVLDLAGTTDRIADVGGRGRQMQALTRVPVVSVNIEQPADVIVAADHPLPFPDRAFGVVTSCDVLEHVPAEARHAHLAELVRIARDRVVLCFPHGSPAAMQAERHMRDTIKREYDVSLDFLDEHVELGLPDTDQVTAELRDLDPDGHVETSWSRDRAMWDEVLIDAMRARYGKDPRALARTAGTWFRRRRRADLFAEPGPDGHRAFVVLNRGGSPDLRPRSDGHGSAFRPR
ncbi:hypothetical protein ASD30_03485 [Nocardioides sp. Root140]|nr:hypothetical protein ASD30_03485 [Nocardioides sp. Root140]